MNRSTFRVADLIPDALHGRDRIEFVTCRHEASASLAAIADAKLTGRASVAVVSRAPGTFNTSRAPHCMHPTTCEESS
jgi:thiamine pyrophosphate-dependent acetolactate synthase large subunit-like protein